MPGGRNSWQLPLDSAEYLLNSLTLLNMIEKLFKKNRAGVDKEG